MNSKQKEQMLELLQIYKIQLNEQESFIGKLFKFQKSEIAINFEKKYSIKNILVTRIDDLIYLAMLLTILIFFASYCYLDLKNTNSQNKAFISYINIGFQQYCIMIFIASLLWMIIPHWYNRYAVMPFIFILLPIFIFLVFNNIIVLDQIQKDVDFMTYVGYLTLPVIYIEVLLVYPLKQYIREKVGSIYSFLYAYSIMVILFLWPTYQILKAISGPSGILSLQFINSNISIIYTIWGIILFFVYIYIHQKLCSPTIQTMKQILLNRFTQQQITNYISPQPAQSFLLRHYKLFVRAVSFVIFTIYVSIEIYFLYLFIGYIRIFDLVNMLYMLFMILYVPFFLIFGSLIVQSKIHNQYLFIILSVFGILPSCSYILLFKSYNSGIVSIVLLAIGPFTVIFWLIIKSIQNYQRIYILKTLFYLFAFFYIPAVGFAMNEFQLFTTDPTAMRYISFVSQFVPAAAALIVILYYLIIGSIFIYRFIEANKKKIIVQKVLDYNYYQQGQPEYVPYKKDDKFSLEGLIETDLISFGYLFNSVTFILSQVVCIYGFNEIINVYHIDPFFSPNIQNIVITQFIMIALAYLCLQMHITIQPFKEIPTILLAILILSSLCSCILVGVSFVVNIQIQFVCRLVAVLLIVVIVVMVGVSYLKNSNEKIHNFLSPATVFLLWILGIGPFFVAIPIMSIFVQQKKFGNFMYNVISASTIVIIAVVALITLIFNVLMNKFQQQKKIKYISSVVQQLLNQEGVEVDDNILNILYQSYDYRDIKYVYFLKRGFPINLYEDNKQSVLVTYDQYKQLKEKQKNKDTEEQLKKKQQEQQEEQQRKRQSQKSYCLQFLDCLFGDDQTVQQKIQKIVTKKKVKKNFIDDLMPLSYLSRDYGTDDNQNLMLQPKQKIINNQHKNQFVSTRTIILNGMVESKRKFVSDHAESLKYNPQLKVELWHIIFRFFSNQDYPPRKMIYNDLKIFITKSKIDVDMPFIDKLYDQYANQEWGEMYSLNQKQFALLISEVCEERIEESDYQTKMEGLLLESIYPNLNKFREFRQFIDNFYRIGPNTRKYQQINIQDSPFVKYKQIKYRMQSDAKAQKLKYNKIKIAERQKKTFDQMIEQQKKDQKQQSCKKMTKRNLLNCWNTTFNCIYTTTMYIPNKIRGYFRQNKQEHKVTKKRIKPWDILSVQCIKTIQNSQVQYAKGLENEYVFRLKFDNLLPASMKLLDLYYFISLSLSDTNINWTNSSNSNVDPNSSGGAFYQSYVILFWLSIALTFVYLLMSLKAVIYIAEGRFGLTQTGAEAAFPHPMFFFTNIYKSLSLSLFSFIMTNIFDTFNCDWLTSQNEVYILSRQKSIVCLQSTHTIYMSMAVIGLFIYYPISAYVMPNFQFAEKTLDLKYKPSYLVIYFQCKFVLVAAGVLLATHENLEIIYISIVISVLVILSFSIINTMPCMINWFNYVDLIILLIALAFNVCGLALYLTHQRLYSIIAVSVFSGVLIIIFIIYFRVKYFKQTVEQIVDNQQMIMKLQNQQNNRKILLKREINNTPQLIIQNI